MIYRAFTKRLKEFLDVFPVVAVVGPRQVGKSTLVQMPEIGAERQYVTLDDLTARALALKDPRALFARNKPLTIDEVQLAPELLRCIKQEVDTNREPGRFIITGSADLNYCVELSHVLAGRVGVLQLPPITLYEENGSAGVPVWVQVLQGHEPEGPPASRQPFDWRRIETGGFPLAMTSATDQARRLWFESFRSTYLERDLRRMSDIGSLIEFARLMELSAARCGQVLNQAALARDCGLSTATAGRYLSLLEASLLINRLTPYYSNIGKRLVKSPKLYWQDTGLAAHLIGVETDMLPQHRHTGSLFETLAMSEVRALLPLFFPRARLFYLRTHDGLEIDGLIQNGEKLTPFEVKAARTVTPKDAVPIEKWLQLSGTAATGFVLYAGTEICPLSRHVWALPITATT